MSSVRPFTDEQSRLLVNLRQRDEGWMDVERISAALPYDLRRKHVNGRDYLYVSLIAAATAKAWGRCA